MMIGQTGMNGLNAFSPWFSRSELAAVFSAEVIDVGGGGTLSIDVQHRNNDETAATSLGTIGPLGAAGVTSSTMTGIKEQVRFAYAVGGTSDSDWVHFRMLNPSWIS